MGIEAILNSLNTITAVLLAQQIIQLLILIVLLIKLR